MGKTLGKLGLHEHPLGQRSGYTVIELMVVVGLIAIVTAVALPYFSSLIDRWRVNQGIAQLQNIMRFASAHAIRTRSSVFIAQSKSAACRQSLQDPKNWSCGLTVFQDINGSKTQDTDDPVLQEVPPFHALTISYSGGNHSYLAYKPYGAPLNSGHIKVSPAAHPDSPAAQMICFSVGGRMRIEVKAGSKSNC